MKKNLIILCLALTGCPETKEKAQRLVPVADGAPKPKCVTEAGRDSEVSFCTDGKTLASCTDDGGCITVNLPAERP